ncbi:type VI secretion system baseplate subunit TssG [Algicola sagamiensis]|uniref:type VI secretion system baseplate subunit TssG n=1 Tax=Algicola sagamiensis TaxID=163869 RepID=UPI00037182F6|nr:type VI secretion system baseplate subunit TssG [Algicola sagamiensis]
MATAHWRTGHTVNDLIKAEDAGWSFLQLVRVLLSEKQLAEQQPPKKQQSGSHAHLQACEVELSDDQVHTFVPQLLEKHFRFTASHRTDFPPNEVCGIRTLSSHHLSSHNRSRTDHERGVERGLGQTEKIYEIESIGNHLNGFGGPLPEGVNELIAEDKKLGEGALSDFMDLFNHRFQALRYLLRAMTDQGLTNTPIEGTQLGHLCLALSGNIEPEHLHFIRQRTSLLISLAGSLANRRMNVTMIQTLFREVLDVEVIQIDNLLGRWLTVDEADYSLLGHCNHRLGDQATLGTRYWDQQAMIGVVLGPLAQERLNDLLPDATGHSALKHLLRWITDERCDCEVTLVAKEDIHASAKLGKTHRTGNRLNMLSFLQGNIEKKQVTFRILWEEAQ